MNTAGQILTHELGLRRHYQTTKDTPAAGVQDVSFTLPAGSFFTLLGPSGCGKTTTLRCVAGLERPDAGRIALGSTVYFDSAARLDMPVDRRGLGMVFQSYAIWPHLSVFENVAFPLRVGRKDRPGRAELRQRVDEALDMVGLTGFAARSATQLSGGQQQRVALARAMIGRPHLLLLDEPLSNLDASLRDEMRLALKSLQQRVGVTTIYVTHDQAEALEMSDSIAVMHRGRIVQLGTPRDIYERPVDAFVADFVGGTNLLTGTLESATATLGRIRLAGGLAMACRLEATWSAGTPIAASVRPEAIAVLSAGTPSREGDNRLPGRVVSIGFTGAATRCIVLGRRRLHPHQPAARQHHRAG